MKAINAVADILAVALAINLVLWLFTGMSFTPLSYSSHCPDGTGMNCIGLTDLFRGMAIAGITVASIIYAVVRRVVASQES